MVNLIWGKEGQLQFANEEEYYEVLGALCNQNVFRISFEKNTLTNSWGDAYRIHCDMDEDNLLVPLRNALRDGYRINCNEYIMNLIDAHNFQLSPTTKKVYGNVDEVRETVPEKYIPVFDEGYSMYN